MCGYASPHSSDLHPYPSQTAAPSYPWISGLCTLPTRWTLRRTDWGGGLCSAYMYIRCHEGSKFQGPRFPECDLESGGWRGDQWTAWTGPRAKALLAWYKGSLFYTSTYMCLDQLDKLSSVLSNLENYWVNMNQWFKLHCKHQWMNKITLTINNTNVKTSLKMDTE